MKEIRRILFIRTDRMGDVLMNLPALRALRLSYPKAWITLLADRPVSGLFRDHPDLDEIMETDAGLLASSFWERIKLTWRVRRVRYDLAVVSNSSKFFHWLVFASGIPVRAGWRRKWPFFLNKTLPDKKSVTHTHEMDNNLLLAGLVCEQKWDGKICLGADPRTSAEIKKVLDEFAGDGNLIVVHTGTSNARKRWSEENFILLCRALPSRRAEKIVFIGGQEEGPTVKNIASRLASPYLDLCGKTTLRELAALFADPRVRVLVSSDSGPVHLAWIAGKPVVAFYALDVPGSDPARWGPRNGNHELIYKFVRDIKPDEVLAGIERVLA